MKLPQLRLIATDFCDSKCIYCRPSGEAVCRDKCKHSLSLDTAIDIAKLYKKYGGNDIKITGGDPVYWNHLLECVEILKKDLNYEKVEVITRSVKIIDLIDRLIENGLDSINFSLDTLNSEKYKMITGKDDFQQLLEIIKSCASKIHCKINTVVMKNINDDELENMIEFCLNNNIKELKFLDIISDLHESKINNSCRLEENYNTHLENLYTSLNSHNKYFDSIEPKTVFQGGLGHPLKVYSINDLNVIIKDATNGAWYGKCCEKCNMYPCHDALMALRVLPSDNFQICLMNEENVHKFKKDNKEKVLLKCLDIYKNAQFRGE